MPLSKVPLQLSCRPPSDTGRPQWGLPGAFSSPGWTAPTLSAFRHRRGAPALWSSLWAPLDPLQQVHVFPVLRAPELDTGLQVGSHQSRAEEQNHLPLPAGHAFLDAAQDTVGLLGCKCTLRGHVELHTQIWYRYRHGGGKRQSPSRSVQAAKGTREGRFLWLSKGDWLLENKLEAEEREMDYPWRT